MIGDEDVSLFWIQQLEAFYCHANPGQQQPFARTKERPRINEVVLIDKPDKQKYRRPANREQSTRHKQRPPVMQTTYKTAPPLCARLHDCRAFFHILLIL